MFLKIEGLLIDAHHIKSFEVSWNESRSIDMVFYNGNDDAIIKSVVQIPKGMTTFWLEDEISKIIYNIRLDICKVYSVDIDDIVGIAIDTWERVAGKKEKDPKME